MTIKFSDTLNKLYYNVEKPEENLANLEKTIHHKDFFKLKFSDQASIFIRYAHECYNQRKFNICWKYYKFKLLSKIKIEKYPASLKNPKNKIILLEDITKITKDKKLLIWDDGGFGDIFLHSRLLSLFPKKTNYKIKLRKNLNWIFKNEYKKRIIIDDQKEKFDFHTSFMMLEPLFNFEPYKLNVKFNYLINPNNKKWGNYFKKYNKNKKIGLVLTTKTTESRNIQFNLIRKLIKIKSSYNFFLIDQAPSSESVDFEKKQSNFFILSKIDKQKPFFDTYSIINYLDILISVDTATSHLAGYLGKKTYLILHKPNHYYWGIKSKKSIFYKNHILIRQKKPGNWTNVVDDLIKKI